MSPVLGSVSLPAEEVCEASEAEAAGERRWAHRLQGGLRAARKALAFAAVAAVLQLLGACGRQPLAGRQLGTSLTTAPHADRARALAAEGQDPAAFCRDFWNKAVERDIDMQKHEKGYYHDCLGLPAKKNTTGIVVCVGKTGTPTTVEEMRTSGLFADYAWMHAHPARQEHFDIYKDFVITVRDPVARTASAFAWMLTKGDSGVHVSDSRKNGAMKFFWKCFPDFDTFARKLAEDSPCGNTARHTLRDPQVDRGHINKGLCYYVGGLIEKLGNRTVSILRTENHREDFNGWLRRVGRPALPDSYIVHKHDNSQQKGISIELSEKGRRILESHLDFEYWAYSRLLALGGHDGSR